MILPRNEVFLRFNTNSHILVIDEGHEVTYFYESNLEKRFMPLDIYVDKNASLKLIWIIDSEIEGDFDVSIYLGENSFCKVFLLNLGQSFSVNIKVELLEKKTDVDIKTVYVLLGEENFNLNVFLRHLAPFSKSNLVVKGILKNEAKLSFKGAINIGKIAEKVSASQVNRTLVIGDGPTVESVPILEIENDNIEKCSHGSVVRGINDEDLFYIESRGIEERTAIKILSVAFLQDLLDESLIEAPFLRDFITEKLMNIFQGE
ncbi:MAG: SufD family Fe-S cluster assembly protein [bacterium]|nr:SufD family Fe-S cluster assembly protein [bacterium]